ncbi:hypothetical protein MGMO_35c00200 [Methyloglobulus morosus KoM1]|uniref:Uncharacterized protein n=1 Tax=Methyloglobulus morosus KoM1 TaxID=1116472 RepID=V5BZ76_9GAMM|nr:hypothetical protein MGMO_35c00200 [Methyloglobulus morosus KoM1]
MDEVQDQRLLDIWSQKRIPVVYKQARSFPVLVRLPYAPNNRDWLRGDQRRKPEWNEKFKCWETPQAWFDYDINLALQKYGKVFVVQLYKEQQKCAPACWNAEGFHCECSCMGANHGSGHPGGSWHEISDTFAFSWGEKKYACRLVSKKTL